MKTKKLNAVQVCKKIDVVEAWKQYEDLAVPRLKLSVYERAIYTHLVRHSRLEGKPQLRFSIDWLAGSACLKGGTVRKELRSLVAKGAVRLVERSKRGHVVEVRLPEEIRAVRAGQDGGRGAEMGAAREGSATEIEEADFLSSTELRQAIHRREGGRCFYCMRRVKPSLRCLDHVVPQVEMGGNSYRNLVSSCMECNAQKREWRAEDFVRWLYREGRLSEEELKGRLRALKALASGNLRPRLEEAKK